MDILLSNCEHNTCSINLFKKDIDSKLAIVNSHDKHHTHATLSSTKILLVEDDVILQKVNKIMLNMLDCAVDIAGNAQAALEKLTTHTYDLLIIDIGLPDINGIELTRQIRALPNLNFLPIIALTAFQDIEQECFGAGVSAYLVKPVELETLKNTIVTLLNTKM